MGLKVNCPSCNERLALHVDTSCGVPEDVGVYCENCETESEWHLAWWYEYQLDDPKAPRCTGKIDCFHCNTSVRENARDSNDT